MVRNYKNHEYTYNDDNLLTQVKTSRATVTYVYDHLKRLIAIKQDNAKIMQFFYAFLRQPRLVSHIFEPATLRLRSLVYDEQGHVIFVRY